LQRLGHPRTSGGLRQQRHGDRGPGHRDALVYVPPAP
jgi:hypothetical protein